MVDDGCDIRQRIPANAAFRVGGGQLTEVAEPTAIEIRIEEPDHHRRAGTLTADDEQDPGLLESTPANALVNVLGRQPDPLAHRRRQRSYSDHRFAPLEYTVHFLAIRRISSSPRTSLVVEARFCSLGGNRSIIHSTHRARAPGTLT